MPVEQFDSGKSRKNRDIYSNLKKDDHPDITFTLNNAEVNGSNGNEYEVMVNGVINAAGVDHAISFISKVSMENDGKLNISGATSVKFSDFNIDRPSAMLGIIRADDEIEIVYNLVLRNR